MWYLSFFALVFGLGGSILACFLGVPPDIDRGGWANLALGNDDAMDRRVWWYKTGNRVGMGMIALAFLLQLVVLWSTP